MEKIKLTLPDFNDDGYPYWELNFKQFGNIKKKSLTIENFYLAWTIFQKNISFSFGSIYVDFSAFNESGIFLDCKKYGIYCHKENNFLISSDDFLKSGIYKYIFDESDDISILKISFSDKDGYNITFDRNLSKIFFELEYEKFSENTTINLSQDHIKNYTSMNLKELKDECRKKHIKGFSSMNKNQLISILAKK